MSSSKIIKSDCADGIHIEKYTFDTVHGPVAADPEVRAKEFVPFLAMMNEDMEDCREDLPEGGDECGAAEELLPAECEELTSVSEQELCRQIQDGYDRGFEEGKRQAERGLANVFKALREAMEELAGLREQVLRESEEDLLKLSIMVARKVIHQEIATDRLILAKVVSAAIGSAPERDEIVIRLNPEDYRIVTAHKNLYLNGCGDDRLMDLKADDSIPQGGCIVDTAMGEIDARTDAQLDEIFRRLLEEKCNSMNLVSIPAGEKEHHAYEEN